jgi:AraC-like DNA-binding protein
MNLWVHSRRSDILDALERLHTLPDLPEERTPITACIVRGYRLEMSRGLRTVRGRLPPSSEPVVDALCRSLEDGGSSLGRLRELAGEAHAAIHDDRPALAGLAESARSLIETGRAPRTVAALARQVGTNARRLERAFQKRYGVSVARLRREYLARTALEGVVTGDPLKQVVWQTHCSESTLRRILRRRTGRTARGWKGRRPRVACCTGHAGICHPRPRRDVPNGQCCARCPGRGTPGCPTSG